MTPIDIRSWEEVQVRFYAKLISVWNCIVLQLRWHFPIEIKCWKCLFYRHSKKKISSISVFRIEFWRYCRRKTLGRIFTWRTWTAISKRKRRRPAASKWTSTAAWTGKITIRCCWTTKNLKVAWYGWFTITYPEHSIPRWWRSKKIWPAGRNFGCVAGRYCSFRIVARKDRDRDINNHWCNVTDCHLIFIYCLLNITGKYARFSVEILSSF